MHMIQKYLPIRSEDPLLVQRGRQLQWLILLLLVLGYAGSLLPSAFPTLLPSGVPIPAGQIILMLVLLTALCGFSIWLTATGRVSLAAHLFFSGSILLLMGQLSATPHLIEHFSYLLLFSIVGIAIFDSVRSSILYAVLYLGLMALVLAVTSRAFLPFLIVSLAVSATAWLSAHTLQSGLRESHRLTKQLERDAAHMARRMSRLHLTVEVGQVAAASLELGALMRNTVELIRNQFGYYHVAIYLMDETGRTARIRESTGKVGEILINRGHHLPISHDTLPGAALATGRPQIESDVRARPDYKPHPLLPDTRSEIALPLLARGELLGVLDVQSREVGDFTEEDITILQLMANQVASSIDNARLFAALQRRLEETQAVYNMISILTTTLDMAEIYRRAARVYADQLNVVRCIVSSWQPAENALQTEAEYFRDPQGQMLRNDATTAPSPFALAHMRRNRPAPPASEPVVRYVDDPNLDPASRELLEHLGHATCLELPLRSAHRPYGIVELFRNSDQSTFSPEEIQIARAMASQVATALNNADLATEAQGRAAELSMLNRVSRILSVANDLQAVFNGARREIFALTEATGISIMLLTEDGEHMEWAYGYEYGREVTIPERVLPAGRGFSGHVVRTGEPLLINERFEEKRAEFQSVTVGRPAAAWLGVPLIVVNKIIGVLAVENGDDPQALTTRDMQLLTTIAGPLAVTIQNQRLLQRTHEALLQQSELSLQLQTAAEVSAIASGILDVNELMQRAVDLIQQRFNRSHVGIMLVDESGQRAVLRAATGTAGLRLIERGFSIPLDHTSLTGATLTDGEPRIAPDVSTHPAWRHVDELPRIRSGVALPLKVRGRIIGALSVQSVELDDFPASLIRVLQTMSDQLAISIDNARLLAEAEGRARRQQLLNQVGARLHRSADVETIIGIGLEAISQHLAGGEVELLIGSTPPRSANGGAAHEQQPAGTESETL